MYYIIATDPGFPSSETVQWMQLRCLTMDCWERGRLGASTAHMVTLLWLGCSTVDGGESGGGGDLPNGEGTAAAVGGGGNSDALLRQLRHLFLFGEKGDRSTVPDQITVMFWHYCATDREVGGRGGEWRGVGGCVRYRGAIAI